MDFLIQLAVLAAIVLLCVIELLTIIAMVLDLFRSRRRAKARRRRASVPERFRDEEKV